jgi:hypothetical protein
MLIHDRDQLHIKWKGAPVGEFVELRIKKEFFYNLISADKTGWINKLPLISHKRNIYLQERPFPFG